MARALPMILALAAVSCDGEQFEPPSEARILLFAVNDPVLDGAAVDPASILWLSTRSGRAWISTPDGRAIGAHIVTTGGEVVLTEIWPTDLEPGDNPLEVRVAPDSGEDPLRAPVLIRVEAECTRRDHCPGGQCFDFACD